MSTVQKKTVLITGCSNGGIGWALTKTFQKRGYHVFATVRNLSTADDLASLNDVEVMQLDVTSLDSMSAARDTVMSRTGGKLDVLVNNAGEESMRPLLDVDIEEAKKLYDINVWGLLAVTQAFAPLVIKARGTIVNQSSIDGVLSMSWYGIFASSKAAVARLSETLRIELEPVGVRVITSMTGSISTPMWGKEGGKMDLPKSSMYFGVQEAAEKERAGAAAKASSVHEFAEQLVKDIVGGAKGKVWHGTFAALVRFAAWAFPTSTLDKMVNGERGLQFVKPRQ